jgi:hypothetical protein
MSFYKGSIIVSLMALFLVLGVLPANGQWVKRDHRMPPRGPWLWALPRELPQLYREFNGIDFGHAHLAETLLTTQDPQKVEKARLEVLEFIFNAPPVQPDEEQIAPTYARMVWELQKAFDWAHQFHRTMYDVFAADSVQDKEAAYQRVLKHYLDHPDAVTSYPLDLHGKLWSFPESRSFRDKFPKFNTQIWTYHWLQAATYDVQLMGGSATQRKLMPQAIAYYHSKLRNPPVEWQMMPMTREAAPEFAAKFPEATAIFDNLHMLHDNVDDVLSRPDLFPTLSAKRVRIIELLQIYLHRNHVGSDRYAEFRLAPTHQGHAHAHQEMPGPRPPSVHEVLGRGAHVTHTGYEGAASGGESTGVHSHH